jgi:hypothetical protein
VQGSDVVSIANQGGDSTVSALKHQPAHRWYFYPDMTTDEVVIFKQFEQSYAGAYVPGKALGNIPVFHTAFEDPASSPGVEKRKSFEYRLGVLLK